MLRLFRSIRQSLANTAGIRKYLLYAIGEIILVMIGILLALQVNNWNETQKNGSMDRDFLLNLRQELRVDSTAISDKIRNYEIIDNLLLDADSIMLNKSAINEADRQIISNALRRLEVFSPMQKLASSGDTEDGQSRLERIDPQLNLKLKAYLEFLRYTTGVMSKLGETLQQLVTIYIHPNVQLDYLHRNDDETVLRFDYNEIRNSKTIRNAMSKSYVMRKAFVKSLHDQLEMLSDLLYDIERHLQSN